MDTITDLHALVPANRRTECETALRRGLPADEIKVRPAPPGAYVLRDDRLYDDASAARRGAGVGALVGAALAVGAWVAGLLTAGPWAMYVLAAAAFGAGVGAVIGMQMHEVLDDDPVGHIEIDDGEWFLVTVHSGHWAARAHRLLACREARLVEQDQPMATGR
jgi:hypothetical protein